MDDQRKTLVLDANILVRAALGPRVRELIIAHAADIDLFTPTVCFDDAARYVPLVLARRGIDPSEALEVIRLLRPLVRCLELEWLAGHEAAARARLRGRDEDDWPILAAALMLSCPVWTEDTDLFGIGIATWSTLHVAEYLKS